MKILSRQDIKTGKIFVNLILTEEEVKRLMDGKVINGEEPYLSIQIVGYGEEKDKKEGVKKAKEITKLLDDYAKRKNIKIRCSKVPLDYIDLKVKGRGV